jgi:hypothetical protein
VQFCEGFKQVKSRKGVNGRGRARAEAGAVDVYSVILKMFKRNQTYFLKLTE